MLLRTRLLVLLCAPLLASCDMLYDVLDIPDPERRAAAAEAEGRAIGGGCRHSGRALEDCYSLNPQVSKSAIFAGWREMNDYMTENNLSEVPTRMDRNSAQAPASRSLPSANGAAGSDSPLPITRP
ncbi:MAG: hypothetical protein H2060_05290 [Azoarcus sp.]|nr:hypothetical protein [Azoarcus sp.]